MTLLEVCVEEGGFPAIHAGSRNMRIVVCIVAAAIAACDGTAFCANGSVEVRNENLRCGRSSGFCRRMQSWPDRRNAGTFTASSCPVIDAP